MTVPIQGLPALPPHADTRRITEAVNRLIAEHNYLGGFPANNSSEEPWPELNLTARDSQDWNDILHSLVHDRSYTVTLEPGDYSATLNRFTPLRNKSELTIRALTAGTVTMDAAFKIRNTRVIFTNIDFYRPSDSVLVNRDFFDVKDSTLELVGCVVTEAYGNTRLIIGRTGTKVNIEANGRDCTYNLSQTENAQNIIDSEAATAIEIRGIVIDRDISPERYKVEFICGADVNQAIAIKTGAAYLRSLSIIGYGSAGTRATKKGIWVARGADFDLNVDPVATGRCEIINCDTGICIRGGGAGSIKNNTDDADPAAGVLYIDDCNIGVWADLSQVRYDISLLDTSGCDTPFKVDTNPSTESRSLGVTDMSEGHTAYTADQDETWVAFRDGGSVRDTATLTVSRDLNISGGNYGCWMDYVNDGSGADRVIRNLGGGTIVTVPIGMWAKIKRDASNWRLWAFGYNSGTSIPASTLTGVVLPENGGTGIVNSNSNTITVGGQVAISNKFTTTGGNITITDSTGGGKTISLGGNVTTSGGNFTLTDSAGGGKSLSLGGNLTTSGGNITLTDSAGGGKTMSLAGNLTTSGGFNLTLTLTAGTGVTLPTSGTLVARNSTDTLTNKTLDLAKVQAYTVATLPAGAVGQLARVTDGDATLAWGATVVNSGAGATNYLVWFNGTNWTVFGI